MESRITVLSAVQSVTDLDSVTTLLSTAGGSPSAITQRWDSLASSIRDKERVAMYPRTAFWTRVLLATVVVRVHVDQTKFNRFHTYRILSMDSRNVQCLS